MAKLTDPLAAERPTPRLAGGIARMQVVAPSGAEGQGLQVMGQQVEAGAEKLYKQQQVEEERINTLRAEEAYTQLRERQIDLTMGEQNGFTKLKGSAAVTRPLLPEWMKRFGDAESEIAGTLTNDAQKLKFNARAQVGRLQFQEDILRHLGREGDNYGKQVFDGIMATEQRSAVSRWDSPNDVASSLDRIKNAVEERAGTYSWDANYKNAVLMQEQGKVHSAVVQQAVATGNFKYAQAWYEQYKESIDLPTAKLLERAVEDGTQKELANGYKSQYLANEGNFKALDGLRKTVLEDKTLDDGRRNQLVGLIQNRQMVLERRAEVAETKRLNMIQRGVTALNSSTLAGFEPNPEQFAPLHAAAKGTELEGAVKQAQNLATATRSFRNMLPLQQERLLAEAEAGVRNEPNKFDRTMVSAWRQIYDAQRRQVQDNPVSFAVQQGIEAPPQPLDLSNPQAAAGALHERFSMARGLAGRYQAPFKPLTKEEVSLLQSTLKGATVEQKRQYFGSLATASGADTQGYMGIMAQLAPDDPVTAIAGSQSARGRTAEADLILRGQAILSPATKADGKPDSGGLLPMPPEGDLRLKFDSYIREAFAGKAEARNAHYQAAKAAYAALSMDAGDRDTKALNTGRWERAMEVAVGKVERVQGRRVILPTGYDLSQFRDDLRVRVDELAQSGRMDPAWTPARLRDLPIQNVGDGRYILRAGDQVVLDKSGSPVTLNFNIDTPKPNQIEMQPTEGEMLEAERPYFGRTDRRGERGR